MSVSGLSKAARGVVVGLFLDAFDKDQAPCPACNTSLSGDCFLRLTHRARAAESNAPDP
jgi:hypothetical protein